MREKLLDILPSLSMDEQLMIESRILTIRKIIEQLNGNPDKVRTVSGV